MSLLVQVVRNAGLDRNPMRRRSDRVEAWSRLFTVLVLVLVVPAIAWVAGQTAYRDGTRIEASERASRHQTRAVLVQTPKNPSSSAGIAPPVIAAASWTLPDGSTRTGWVSSRVGATAGTSVPLWIDAEGLPTTPPRSHDETVAQTLATAVLVPLVVALLACGAQAVIRTVLDRRRLAQWQCGWLRVEPLWSGRPPGSAP